MIRAVTFDWWNTLVRNSTNDYIERLKEIRLRGIQTILQQYGHAFDYRALSGAYDAQGEQLHAIWQMGADLDPAEQIVILLKLLDAKLAGELIAKLIEPYSMAVLKHPPVLSLGALETLKELKARGLKLGLISNTGRSSGAVLREVQRRFGIRDYFDTLTFSNEQKVRKPAREIFERTLRALGVKASESVHIGDAPDSDIEGAKSAGMRAIWYNSDGSPVSADLKADAVIQDLREVLDFVESAAEN